MEYKTINIISDSIGENPQNLGLSNEFLDLTPNTQSVREKKLLSMTKFKF